MHRTFAALIVLAFVPWAAAEPIQVIEDPEGDLKVYLPDGTEGPAVSTAPSVDIRSVTVEEERQSFGVSLQVADVNVEDAVPFFGSGSVDVTFWHADRQFMLSYDVFYTPTAQWEVDLFTIADGEVDAWLGELAIEVDASENTITVSVPRDLLADSQGAAPFPGRSLTDFEAQAAAFPQSIGVWGGPAGNVVVPGPLRDRAPDDGPSDVEVPVVFGVEQTGHARLASTTPFRASNGEAATFVFTVLAANLASEEDRFTLHATGVPQGWSVSFPRPTLTMGASATAEVPVIVSTPFAHDHGSAESFHVVMQSATDEGSTGRVELGIRYLAIPQPAGHHDRLYLHSQESDNLFDDALALTIAGQGAPLYMNTLEEDPRDTGLGRTGFMNGSWFSEDNTFVTQFAWDVPLSPRLEMGLDFDLDRVGSISVPIETTFPLPQARLGGALMMLGPDDSIYYGGTPIATIEGPKTDVEALSTAVLEGEITPLEEADRIPFEEGQQLILRLNLTAERFALFVSSEAPVLMPGAWMQLPLFDYTDEIDVDLFDSPVRLSVPQPQRAAPPGSTLVFPVEIRGPAGDYQVSVYGAGAEWTSAPRTVSVDATGTAHVEVAVPHDAADSTRADLIVEAVSVDDEAMRGLVRLVVNVVEGEEPIQEGTPQTGGKEASMAVWTLLAAMGAAALLARRR